MEAQICFDQMVGVFPTLDQTWSKGMILRFWLLLCKIGLSTIQLEQNDAILVIHLALK